MCQPLAHVWDGHGCRGSAVRLNVHRGRAHTAMHAPGSGGVSSSGEFEPRQRHHLAQQPPQQPPQQQPQQQQQQQQQQQAPRMPSHDTILTRARLRRGSHLLRVRALLYITPDKCKSTDSLLGQAGCAYIVAVGLCWGLIELGTWVCLDLEFN